MLINPASLRSSAIGFGALAGILILSYAISSGSDYESYKNISESGSRWVFDRLERDVHHVVAVGRSSTLLFT